MERKAGTNNGSTHDSRLYIRPSLGVSKFNNPGWYIFRNSILNVSQITIKRKVNQIGGFDYIFCLRINPKYFQLLSK